MRLAAYQVQCHLFQYFEAWELYMLVDWADQDVCLRRTVGRGQTRSTPGQELPGEKSPSERTIRLEPAAGKTEL